MARDMLTVSRIPMLSRCVDSAMLGLVSVLYSIAVFFLKQRKA
jgi:hypothetical protein